MRGIRVAIVAMVNSEVGVLSSFFTELGLFPILFSLLILLHVALILPYDVFQLICDPLHSFFRGVDCP